MGAPFLNPEDKIFLAVATYNRFDLTKISSNSLSKLKQLDRLNVYVFDDRSSEYGKEDLLAMFPFAKEVRVRPQNLRADGNMRQIFLDFLNSPAQEEVLFLGDSDLVYHEDFYPRFRQFWSQTKGVLSFFRSAIHPEKASKLPGLVEKAFLPALGTFIHRKLIEKVFAFPLGGFHSKFFDWYWSSFFRRLDIPLYATEQGLVQHLGIVMGQNTKISGINKIQVSYHFVPSNLEDEHALFEIWDQVLQRIPRLYLPKNMLRLPYWLVRHYVRYGQIRFCIFWHFFKHQGRLRRLRKEVHHELGKV